MESNTPFSFQRFIMLFKQSLRINRKLIGISISGLAVAMFLSLVLSQYSSKFLIWYPDRSMPIFRMFFFLTGIIYSSRAFPAFRSKEKTMSYLMLPASNLEKFTFEFLTRIVAYILLMPFLFWTVANLEGAIIHHYIKYSETFFYKFPLSTYLGLFSHTTAIEGWNKFGGTQIGLFALIAVFTGASYFVKSPLIKTMFTFSIVLIGFSLFSFLLYKGLNLNTKNISPEGMFIGVFFVKTKDEAAVVISLLLAALNMALLAIAWFSLKEKEA